MEVIAAVDFSSGGIGYNGHIPWSLPPDMERFKRITTAAPPGKYNMVVMGLRTWESLGRKPLKNRINVIVTSSIFEVSCDNVLYVSSLDEALDLALLDGSIHKILVIGGTKLYDEAMRHQLCQVAHITYVHKHGLPADTFFPLKTLNYHFEVYNSSPILNHKTNIRYSFLTYTRKNSQIKTSLHVYK